MKTLLPTSTAGSLPKPTWLAQPETLWSPWKLQDDELLAGKQDALRLSLDEQLRAGIDIVSDGEQTRQHFVTTFIEHLSGVDFENRQTVRIRNRYDASVPTVVDAATIAMELTGSDNADTVLPQGRGMMVTPREIDLLIDRASRLVAMTINRMLQPEYSPLELIAIAV